MEAGESFKLFYLHLKETGESFKLFYLHLKEITIIKKIIMHGGRGQF